MGFWRCRMRAYRDFALREHPQCHLSVHGHLGPPELALTAPRRTNRSMVAGRSHLMSTAALAVVGTLGVSLTHIGERGSLW